MLWKLERIDGDPVLRETRIWATWEYVSSVGGGQGSKQSHLLVAQGTVDFGILFPKGETDVKLTSEDRKSTRLNSSHYSRSRMPSSA